jgi:hypothetical protein
MLSIALMMIFIMPICITATGQSHVNPNVIYVKPDSIGIFYAAQNFKTHQLATQALISGCKSQLEKARAIFSFVAHRIKYDFNTNAYEADEVLKHKYAVCQGYANLINAMMKDAGIQSEVITGYTKAQVNIQQHDVTKTNHAWNAVKLDNTWQLIDATWGAGSYDYGTKKFTALFEENYFLADPEMMKYTHFPLDTGWQLIDKKVDATTFINYPFAWRGFEINNITNISPDKFKLKYKAGEKFILSFTSNESIEHPLLNIEGERYSYPFELKKIGDNQYSSEIELKFKGTKQVTFFLNGTGVATYMVTVN